MKLKVKILNIATKGPLIAILNKADAMQLDLVELDRIRIKKNSKERVVVIDLAYGKKTIEVGEIGLFLDVAEELNLKNKDIIEVKPEPKPFSLALIKKKLDGKELSREEINSIVKDLMENELTEIETTYFISGCYIHGMTLKESAYLTEAIVKSGSRLKFDGNRVVDKHSIGGIPGNRTTPIIVSIVAAAGLIMPKTSTRSITSPAGTSDAMEVLAPVSHSKEKILEIVKKTNACMVWGGTMDLAAADDKLIKFEKVLNLDPEGIMLASILAKKSAVDSNKVLIDIPCGKEAKIEDKKRAKNLAKKFVILGKKIGIQIKVIITDGSKPIGKGVGPALEARDVLLVLQNRGPEDLKSKSVYMAGLILAMAGFKNPIKKSLEILENGRAYKKLQEIIKAQGGNPKIQPEEIKLGKYTYEVKALKSGKIISISNNLVSRIAKEAGAPTDKGSGIYLNKSIKEKVEKGEVLFTIYAENKEKLDYVKKEVLEEVYKVN